MDVSENSGTPKSSILIGFSIITHPFWGTPIYGNTHIRDSQEHWMQKNLKQVLLQSVEDPLVQFVVESS